MERSAGILLPIFSLPSPHGIGTLGREAYDFVDFLCRAGQRWWQILPVGPAGSGDSPYQSISTHAGNPVLIDLEALAEDGLLTREELASAPDGKAGEVDYPGVKKSRERLLHQAFTRGWERDRDKVTLFAVGKPWLADYALFRAVGDHFVGQPWQEWPDEGLRLRDPAAIGRWTRKLEEDVRYHTYVQYLFFNQWNALRSYAGSRGVAILGDLPIYVSLNSADVWAEREQFLLDAEGYPSCVAGVPPDYFSADGQLWGNPLYNWERMRADGYGWWIRRVESAGRLFDAVRIDHFRAFASYWSVDAGAKTAREGRWEQGPGMELVGVLTSWFSGMTFIAEDLGLLTPDVEQLLTASKLPGMKVLEFAFSGPDNAYLPHNCVRNCVVYTGTHDNAPVLGWCRDAAPEELAYARRYLGAKTPKQLRTAMLRTGQTSVAELFMAQMQDYLGVGGRMNVPGEPEGNWRWRMPAGALSNALADEIYQLTVDAGRCPPRKAVDAPDRL